MKPFSFIQSGGAPAPFDPATLSLTGWWRADFAGSPWTPTASAGASGSNGNLEEATNPPTTGTAQNSKVPADFDGTDDIIVSTATAATLFNSGAGTIVVLVRADAATAAAGNAYQDARLFGDTNTNFGLFFSSSGIKAAIYDGGAWIQSSSPVALATGAYHLAQMRWDGADMEIRVDGGSWQTDACTGIDPSGLAGTLRIGDAFGGGAFLDGRVLEVMTSDTALVDGDLGNIISYANSRYSLSL